MSSLRRVSLVMSGSVLLGLGVAMLLLPGPGLLTILAGLSLLAREFHWAGRVLDFLKRRFTSLKDRAQLSSQRLYKLVF